MRTPPRLPHAPATPRRPSLGAASLLLVAALVAAAPATAAEEWIQGWHIVRPDDTLRGISELYSGSGDNWQRNWSLNPEIADPDLLLPGQRVRVWISADRSVSSGQMTALSGRVEESPDPIDWLPARRDDMLLERDGIRTYSRSSSQLSFVDGTTVVVGEDSLVFLRSDPGERRRPTTGKTVEILEGQAEIESSAGETDGADVEIVVGSTRATAERGDDGVAQARARREGDGARLMIFEGSGRVANAGTTVDLPRGTGSAIEAGRPPSPPEKLLPHPVPLTPEAESEWQFPNPSFEWETVSGAASYTLEVCRDPGCAELVRRQTGLAAPTLRTDPLPVARLYWRVTAVSPTGLDGYPSPARRFDILSDKLDPYPPTGSLTLRGSSRQTPWGPVWDEAVAVEVELEDRGGEIAEWQAKVNDEPTDAAALAGPWPSGRFLVEVEAVDTAGNRAVLPALEFLVDHDPPLVAYEVGDQEWLEQKLAGKPGTPVRRAFPDWVRGVERFDGQRGRWWPLAWANDETSLSDNFLPSLRPQELAGGYRSLFLETAAPEVLLIAPGLEIPWNDETRRLTDDEVLLLTAFDEHTGVSELALHDDVTEDGHELVIETVDVLGNRGRLRWPVRGGDR